MYLVQFVLKRNTPPRRSLILVAAERYRPRKLARSSRNRSCRCRGRVFMLCKRPFHSPLPRSSEGRVKPVTVKVNVTGRSTGTGKNRGSSLHQNSPPSNASNLKWSVYRLLHAIEKDRFSKLKVHITFVPGSFEALPPLLSTATMISYLPVQTRLKRSTWISLSRSIDIYQCIIP